VAYVIPGDGASDLSHTLVAGTGFGVLGGLVVVGLISMALPYAVRVCPKTYQDGFQSALQFTSRMFPSVILSLAIGTWTHLALDSFTHSHGWLAEHWDLLRTPIQVIHGKQLRVCHLLWYLLSFVGLVWLVLAIREWQQEHSTSKLGSRGSYILEGMVVALLILPIEVLHHFVRSFLGLMLVGTSSLVLSAIVIARPLLKRTMRRSVYPARLEQAEKSE